MRIDAAIVSGIFRDTVKATLGVGRLNDQEQMEAQLHEVFSRRIYFFALRELRLHEAAEEVCNETLMRVIKAMRGGKIEDTGALPGFVSGTTRNVIREYRRKQWRPMEPIGELDFPAPEQPGPVDPIVRTAIDMTLTRLKPRERDFLRLYYYEELTKEEISQRLGIIPDRVRLIKSRALSSFREYYLRLTRGSGA